MKKTALLLVAALMMSSSAVTVFAAEKDECLVMSANCKGEVDDMQKKIKKMNAEIKKGSKVYTSEELKKLNEKLKEINLELDKMMKPGK